MKYFKDENNKRVYDDIIWFDSIYIKFEYRLITINVFNKNSDWKSLINGYIQSVLENEEVYISCNNFSKYFEALTSKDLVSLFTTEVM